MDEIVRQFEPTRAVEEIRIGEIAGQRRIVVPQARTEKQGRLALDREHETGEMPGVPIVDAQGAAESRAHAALAVEHPKALAVFEHERPNVLERRRCGDSERLALAGTGGADGAFLFFCNVLHDPSQTSRNPSPAPCASARGVVERAYATDHGACRAERRRNGGLIMATQPNGGEDALDRTNPEWALARRGGWQDRCCYRCRSRPRASQVNQIRRPGLQTAASTKSDGDLWPFRRSAPHSMADLALNGFAHATIGAIILHADALRPRRKADCAARCARTYHSSARAK